MKTTLSNYSSALRTALVLLVGALPGFAAEIIIDNGGAEVNPAWTLANTAPGHYGDDYYFAATVAGAPDYVATYRPAISVAGKYDVYLWYAAGSNRASNAPWTISCADGVVTVPVDQTINGGGWFQIASGKTFNAGSGGYVQVSNGTGQSGAVVIADAVRFVSSTAPTVVSQPQNQLVLAGQTAYFSVSATGSAPLSYQWTFNGTSLAGATASTLMVSGAQAANQGTYAVVVNNCAGSATSSDATLTIGFALNLSALTGGYVSKNPDQGIYAPGTTVTVTATPYTGFSFNSWMGDATGGNNPRSVTMSQTKNVTACFIGTSSGIIVDNPQASFTGSWATSSSSTDKYGSDYNYSSTVAGAATATATYSPFLPAGAYDVYIWYPAGSNRASNAPWQIVDDSGTTAYPVNQKVNGGGWRLLASNKSFTASGRYVRLSNGAGATGSIVAADAVKFIYAAAPAIQTQPQSQTVLAGANVSFSVVASGGGPMTYQWRINGGNISGATGAALALNNVQSASAGIYSVAISNPWGTTTSLGASLTVNPVPPSIVSQPQSVAVTPGATVVFTVTASGSAPLYYQWLKDGDLFMADCGNASGSCAASLTLTGVTEADFGNYSVRVLNTAGSVTSASASLSLPCNEFSNGSFENGYAGWVPQDLGLDMMAGAAYDEWIVGWASDGQYSMALSHAFLECHHGSVKQRFCVTPGSSYQVAFDYGAANSALNARIIAGQTVIASNLYRREPDNSNFQRESFTFTVPSGVTFVTLMFEAEGDSNSYYMDPCIDNVTVTPCAAPSIATQPQSLAVNAGSSASFSVVAAGVPSPSYQWHFNGSDIANATGSSCIIPDAQTANAGSYSVTVNNALGSVTSLSALLTINPVVPSITLQPQSQSVDIGSTVVFTAAASGSEPLYYQWYKDGIFWMADWGNVSGSSTPSLTLSDVSEADVASYSLRVLNGVGSVISSAASLSLPCHEFVNGSFENGFAGWVPQDMGAGMPAGSAGDEWLAGLPWFHPTDGQTCVVLTHAFLEGHHGSVKQRFCVAPGAQYRVAFDFGGENSGLDVKLMAGQATLFSHEYLREFGEDFRRESFTFTVPSGVPAVTLLLEAAGDDSNYYWYDPIIDNVTIAQLVPPTIVAQPQSATVTAQGWVALTVRAQPAPFTCQWFKNGVAINGATLPEYDIYFATTDDAGSYTVTVTGAGGSVTSAPATVEVADCAPFQNGSFENGFTGWQMDESDWIAGPPVMTTDGSHCVEFDGCSTGGHGGTIRQSFCVEAGAWYEFSLDYAGVTIPGRPFPPMIVFAGCYDASGHLYTFCNEALQTTGSYQTKKYWFQVPANVTAMGISIERYPGEGNEGAAPTLLDNVKVQKLQSDVPVIIRQPQSSTVIAGSMVTLAVTAVPGPFTYQWTKNNAPIDGATGSEYDIWGASASDAGTYTVTVTGAGGSVVSANAIVMLSSADCAPFQNGSFENGLTGWFPNEFAQVVGAPIPTTDGQNCLELRGCSIGGWGGSVYQPMCVDADSTYEVSFDYSGLAVAGHPFAPMTVEVSYPGDNGWPQVLYSKAFNPTGSYQTRKFVFQVPQGVSAVTLWIYSYPGEGGEGDCSTLLDNITVQKLEPGVPAILKQPQGASVSVGGWVTLSVEAGPGQLSYQWTKNGVDIDGATWSQWDIFPAASSDSGFYAVKVTGAGGVVLSDTVLVSVSDCAPFQNGSFENGFTGWQHDEFLGLADQPTSDGDFCAEFDGRSTGGWGGGMSQTFCVEPGAWYQFSMDLAGIINNGLAIGPVTIQVSCNNGNPYQVLYEQTVSPTENFQTKRFGVKIPDNVSIVTLRLSRVLGEENFFSPTLVDNVSAQMVPPGMPVLINEPLSAVVTPGACVSFAVTAAPTPLSYQWKKNGVNIANATDSVYNINSATVSDAGSYSVTVTASGGSLSSADATLTLNDCAPFQNGSFENGLTGWVRDSFVSLWNGTQISPSDGQYCAIFSGCYPNGLGGNLYQTFCVEPGATYQVSFDCAAIVAPASGPGILSVAAAANDTVLFSADVTLCSANFETRTFDITIPAEATSVVLQFYRVFGSGGGAAVDSFLDNVVVRKICPGAPVIFSQPQSATVAPDACARFSVVATCGTGTMTYQWTKDGAAIDGATDSAFNIYPVSLTDAGVYAVTVAGPNGPVTSVGASLVVGTAMFQNGSFENGLAGWHYDEFIEWFGPDLFPSQGRYSVKFDGLSTGGWGGGISQSFVPAAPGWHQISLDYAGVVNPGQTIGPVNVQVTAWNNDTYVSTPLETVVYPTQNFQTGTFNFNAPENANRLLLSICRNLGEGNFCSSSIVDNVIVQWTGNPPQ